jgi:hypothetical protein
MPIETKMDIGDKQKIVKSLLKNYLKIDKNLFISNKLFIANSGINWIYNNTKNVELIKHYLKEIDKYLKGDIELYWSNGTLTKKKAKDNDNSKK